MSTAGERLEALRKERFQSRRQAAEALGIPPTTYNQYESGEREFVRHAERFARFFRVNLEWLITGRGERKSLPDSTALRIVGIVGAGATVDTKAHSDIDELPSFLDLPPISELGALRVKGDSQYPRFLDGDHIVFRMVPRPPGELVNQFALVETADGRSLIKRLRYGRREGTFNLESFNAETEENVEIDCAYEHVLTIPGHKGAPKPATPKRR